MNAIEYREAITRLGLSQVRAGPMFGVSGRQSQRWAGGESPIPKAVATLIRLLIKRKIKLEDIK